MAKGGNLLLGVGPTPQGLIQPEAVERLEEVGRWLDKNGRAIYGTVTTPHYHDGDVWFTRSKDGRSLFAILAPGEMITEDILSYINIAKEKGCSMQGPESEDISELCVLK